MRLAETKEDWNRLAESMVMRRAVYPKMIAKHLIRVEPLIPEGCMEVWQGRARKMVKEGKESV